MTIQHIIGTVIYPHFKVIGPLQIEIKELQLSMLQAPFISLSSYICGYRPYGIERGDQRREIRQIQMIYIQNILNLSGD